MNKKGFTLIELLATIAIMGILIVVLFSSIRALISDKDSTKKEKTKEMLISAGDQYIVDERIDFKCNSSDYGVKSSLNNTSKNCLRFSNSELGKYIPSSNINNLSSIYVYIYCNNNRREYYVEFDDYTWGSIPTSCNYEPYKSL